MASDVIRSISDGPDIPDSAGLRIAAMPGDDPALSAMPVASPEAGDHIVEHDGARVFLDDLAASQLDDRVLDAVVDHYDRCLSLGLTARQHSDLVEFLKSL